MKAKANRPLAQGSHRLEKYLNIEGFLEKFLKIQYALKSTGKSLKCLEKSLLMKSSIFCWTYEGGSICNENPFITPFTSALGFYAIS